MVRRFVRWGAALPDTFLFALFFVLPVGVLVAYSFGRQNSLTQDVRITGTLRAYRLLFSDLYRPVIVRSITLSLSCLLMCIAIGFPASLAVTRCTPRTQRRLIVAVMFPSFISFTVRVYAWVGILGNQGPIAATTDRLFDHRVVLLFRPGSLLVGMITAYVPLFLLPVFVSMQRIPRSLIEASMDLGGRSFTALRTIIAPLSAPGLVTGSALVVVLSLGEFLIPTVLGGGKVLLLGTLLAEQGGGRNKPLGAAIGVTLLVTMTVVAVFATVLQRRLDHRHA